MEACLKSGRRPVKRGARGFTYLAILLAIALLGIGLAAVGTMWTTVARRERETQLLFVGHAFRDAIASYYLSGNQLPRELDDLLRDERLPLPRRHLRRIYPDPMTGHPDWQLLRDADGGIYGVSSSSQGVPLKRANFSDADAAFDDAPCYCDWRFEFQPSRRAARRPAH